MLMKRRDHILLVSLDLFNREGETNLTAVDIANELEISPGNLYYHFKGKEEMVTELYEQFETGIETLLQDSRSADASLEEHWLYLYVMLEHIFNYRFFFRNTTDLLHKYGGIDKRFGKLVEKQYQWIHQLLDSLLEEGLLADRTMIASRIDQLADNIMLIFTHWFQFQNLRKKSLDQHQFIQGAILQIMALLAPYLGEQQLQFMETCTELSLREKQCQ